MVKPELDVTIDYYSLLNVSLRADPEEIKKSYRKLGPPSSPSPPPVPQILLTFPQHCYTIPIET
jgi:hypothetical protein